MKSRMKILTEALLSFSLLGLSSCNRPIEIGFSHEIVLLSIMVAARISDKVQSLDRDLTIELAYGHPKSTTTPFGLRNHTPGPVCIYVDNHFKDDDHEADSLDYRMMEPGWTYVKEIESDLFWTDEYAFESTLFKGKTFNHVEEFKIDRELVVSKKNAGDLSGNITIFVAMVWQDTSDKTWRTSIPGSVSIGYDVRDDNTVDFR